MCRYHNIVLNSWLVFNFCNIIFAFMLSYIAKNKIYIKDNPCRDSSTSRPKWSKLPSQASPPMMWSSVLPSERPSLRPREELSRILHLKSCLQPLWKRLFLVQSSTPSWLTTSQWETTFKAAQEKSPTEWPCSSPVSLTLLLSSLSTDCVLRVCRPVRS